MSVSGKCLPVKARKPSREHTLYPKLALFNGIQIASYKLSFVLP